MSTGRATTVRLIEDSGVVGIIRLKDPSRLPGVVEALAEGGVRALEITMTVPGAVELIRRTAASLPSGFLLGAGTVLEVDTARAERLRALVPDGVELLAPDPGETLTLAWDGFGTAPDALGSRA